MRKLSTVFYALTMAAYIGCTQGTPGGPGTTGKSSSQPVYGQTDDTFNLSVPVMSTSVQQGEQTEATIGIKRAKNFDEDVSLTFADVPTLQTVSMQQTS